MGRDVVRDKSRRVHIHQASRNIAKVLDADWELAGTTYGK